MNAPTRTAPIPWVSIAHIAILATAAGSSVYACEAAIAHYVQLDHASRAGPLHQWVETLSATGMNMPLLAAAAVFMVGLPASWLSHRSSFTFPYHACDPKSARQTTNAITSYLIHQDMVDKNHLTPHKVYTIPTPNILAARHDDLIVINQALDASNAPIMKPLL